MVISNVASFVSTGHPVRTKMNLILFQKKIEILLDKLALNNPFMLAVIGDLNAKSKNWYPSDRTTLCGQYNWNHYFSFWLAPINSWSNANLRKIINMYRFDFYFSTQYGCKLGCPFFPSCLLPPPKYICKIWQIIFLKIL